MASESLGPATTYTAAKPNGRGEEYQTTYAPEMPALLWVNESLTQAESVRQPVKSLPSLPFPTLYPEAELLSPALRTAHDLLASTLERCEAAIEATNDDDALRADDHILHAVAHLRELFCLRDIGDGFGAVVNAILASLVHLAGERISLRQLTAIRRRLDALQTRPFLSIDEAVIEIEALEAADLNIEPPGFDVLAAWLESDEEDG